MKPIVFDWDAIEKEADERFSTLPEGTYEVAMTRFELKPSKEMLQTSGQSGFPYFNIELTIQSGEFKGRKLWDLWSLHPNALSFGIGRNLPIFGVVLSGTAEYESYEELAADISPKVLNQRALAIVYHDTYGGRTTEKVQGYASQESITTETRPRSVL